jgi:hypothetical protein
VISESVEQSLTLRLKLPAGATFGALAQRKLIQEDREAIIADRAEGETLVLSRSVRMPAGRVSTGDYAKFSRYITEVTDALSSQIAIRLSPGRK